MNSTISGERRKPYLMSWFQLFAQPCCLKSWMVAKVFNPLQRPWHSSGPSLQRSSLKNLQGLATNSFLFPSCIKSLTPRQGITFLFYSYQQLPCLCLRPLKGSLSWHCALHWPSTSFVHYFWNFVHCKEIRTTVRCALLGAEVPKKLDTNLDCAFVENAFLYTDPWFWKVNRIQLS